MRLASLALLLCVIANSPAAAEERRLLTLDNETSTSDCIGEPRTPLCAVETRMACSYHGRKDYCVAVEVDNAHVAGLNPANPYSYAGVADRWYEVLKQEVIDETNVRFLERGLKLPFLFLGDVAVWLQWTSCWPEDECLEGTQARSKRGYGKGCPKTRCIRSLYPDVSIVRKKDNRWIIVHYSLEFRVLRTQVHDHERGQVRK
jgi:hypothetical protein